MQILSWNSRGLGNPLAVRALTKLVKDEDLDVVFLMETKRTTFEMETVKKRLKLGNMVEMDYDGRGAELVVCRCYGKTVWIWTS